MKKEFDSLVENKTWELCDLPDHKKALGGHWVFALKKGENGQMIKYKARYVAKGFNQFFDRDYLETFAPTATLSSIRIYFAIAVQFGCEVFQFDISSACLNAELEEDVYVEQPPGCELHGNSSKIVCKLLKGLYGSKQAGRCWNRTLDQFLTNFGLVRSTIDNCCYSKTTSAGNKLFVCVWVDDILYFSTCSIIRESFKDSFSRRFKIEVKGLMKWFLGVSVQQSSNEISKILHSGTTGLF